ncbi:DUF4199 domain-containing protein [Psychroflexus sp. YR1-1]|uniref:DUF4199 domain-containing protein n=1 Tax=Psychroflexus aurantiacus TaxID=2709310 RepID=A0A6B3QZ27_9FLAO|nr:DUF4199 domain-containing protein [Psychroflexus aurantiacus]NEV93429.1 DUF4199 domain-containing protein [Psychroflexus aurantiacus]
MKSIKIELKWGFIFIGSLLLWMLLEKWAGLHDTYIHLHQYFTMLFAIVAVAIYVLALKEKRNIFYGGKMTYWQGLRSGIILTLVITIFSPVTQWIISEIITPEYFKNAIEYAVQKGYYKSLAAAESEFNLKTYIIKSSIWALATGIVTSAIVAVFTRKK